MVRKIKFEIIFSNRWIYTLIAIGILVIIGVGVYAYTGNVGHTSDQIDEVDPQVGEVTSDKWCVGDGSAVQCSQAAPSGGDTDWTISGNNIYRSSGKVGIGTTNPLSKLSVGGDGYTSYAIYASAGTYKGIYGKGDHTGVKGYGYLGVHGQGTKTGVSGSGGTSSPGSGTTGVLGYGEYGVYGTGGTAGVAAWGATGACDFDARGPGATDYCARSSIRWKENIIEIDNALDKVLSLEGVYFNWNEEHGGKYDMGMIAEDVGKIVPEVVVYEPDGIFARSMDYGALTPVLVEAIKEQQEIIEFQQVQINELKSRIEQLEN